MLDVDRGHAGHFQLEDQPAPGSVGAGRGGTAMVLPMHPTQPGAWVGAADRLDDRQSKKNNDEECK